MVRIYQLLPGTAKSMKTICSINNLAANLKVHKIFKWNPHNADVYNTFVATRSQPINNSHTSPVPGPLPLLWSPADLRLQQNVCVWGQGEIYWNRLLKPENLVSNLKHILCVVSTNRVFSVAVGEGPGFRVSTLNFMEGDSVGKEAVPLRL